MTYKIENLILIDNPNYGALGDDFSFAEIEALDIIINKIKSVLSGNSEKETIYGNMCYQIDVSKEISSIYCYDEFLGNEPSIDIFNMLNQYREWVLSNNAE
jgi:hypothetical protein